MWHLQPSEFVRAAKISGALKDVGKDKPGVGRTTHLS